MEIAASREALLESAVGRIQARFGAASLHAAVAAPDASEAVDAISSGLPELDAVTSVGGFPTGRLSLCLGAPGSGKMLVGYHFLAQASEAAATVLLLDLRRQADPWLMSRLGVRLDRLIVLRPSDPDLKTPLDVALALARAGVGAIVADLPPRAGKSPLWDPFAATLTAACAKAAVPLVVIAESAAEPLRYAASLVLRLRRQEWRMRHGDISGAHLEVAVEKNKLGPPGRQADFELDYPQGTFLAPRPAPPVHAAEPGPGLRVL